MFGALVLVSFISNVAALIPTSYQRATVRGTKLFAEVIPRNAKPTFDGTWRVPGEHPEEYVLENENGAKAICRTFGGNAFSWVTKDGIEVLGKRKDASDVKSDQKPFAGGVPHCFPQVNK